MVLGKNSISGFRNFEYRISDFLVLLGGIFFCRFTNLEYHKLEHGDVSDLFFIVYEVNILNNNNYFY